MASPGREEHMGIFKLFFFGAAAFLAAVAIFVGLVMMLTSLQNGAVMLSYTSDGKAINETITRAADAARFWKLFTTMGALPAAVGAVALWYCVKRLRTPA
jgi:hypothetical protein